MRESGIKMEFHSPLGELMSKFIREKQACGYSYEIGIHRLQHLDRFLSKLDLQKPQLPKDVVERWIAKRAHEQPGTQKLRIIIIRQFALFVRRQGFDAHVPDTRKTAVIILPCARCWSLQRCNGLRDIQTSLA